MSDIAHIRGKISEIFATAIVRVRENNNPRRALFLAGVRFSAYKEHMVKDYAKIVDLSAEAIDALDYQENKVSVQKLTQIIFLVCGAK